MGLLFKSRANRSGRRRSTGREGGGAGGICYNFSVAIFSMAIVGFKHAGLKRFFEKSQARGLQHRHLKKIEATLRLLDSGDPLKEFGRRPGYRLHQLKETKGVWTVRVSSNWRVTFRVDEYGNSYDVDLVDYH